MNIIYKTSQTKEDISFWYNSNVATNLNTSPEILTNILRRGNDDLVSRIAVQNPNCSKEILEEILRRGKNDDVSIYAVQSPKISSEMLTEILQRYKDDYVSMYAVQNHNCSPEILTEILRRGKDDHVSWFAVGNPNCPSEVLEEILSKGEKNNISLRASKNPSCPAKARIQWMLDTNQITNEDPEKHKIEYDEKHIDDTDFNDFKNLVSTSNNWYKLADNNSELSNLVSSLESEYPGLDLSVSISKSGYIEIANISLPKEMRNRGFGTIIINKIKDFANKLKLPIVLRPEAEIGKKHKLLNFYKNLGFVENKGRSIDYNLSSPFSRTMYWKP